jgi:hypothetical protein
MSPYFYLALGLISLVFVAAFLWLGARALNKPSSDVKASQTVKDWE